MKLDMQKLNNWVCASKATLPLIARIEELQAENSRLFHAERLITDERDRLEAENAELRSVNALPVHEALKDACKVMRAQEAEIAALIGRSEKLEAAGQAVLQQLHVANMEKHKLRAVANAASVAWDRGSHARGCIDECICGMDALGDALAAFDEEYGNEQD